MNLHEYQSKGLFAAYGIPVPRGIPAETPDAAVKLYPDVSIGEVDNIPATKWSTQVVCDAMRKIGHAIKLRGFRFLHILAPCPTGWKSEPSLGIELVRLAVSSGLYPVYEISGGDLVEI